MTGWRDSAIEKRAKMKKLTTSFLRNESGSTAIEYGLLAAFLGIGLVVSLTSLQQGFFTLFGAVEDGLNQ